MTWYEAIEKIKQGQAVRLDTWENGERVYYDVDEDGTPDILPTMKIKEQQAAYTRFVQCLYFVRPDGLRDRSYWPAQIDYLATNWVVV